MPQRGNILGQLTTEAAQLQKYYDRKEKRRSYVI